LGTEATHSAPLGVSLSGAAVVCLARPPTFINPNSTPLEVTLALIGRKLLHIYIVIIFNTSTMSNAATRNLATRFTILGTGGAGKSALVVQFVHSHYCEIYDPTIEDIYRRQWEVDGCIALADILDTAGQDEYTALRSTWFTGSDGFLLVYNMCSRTSYEDAKGFLEQIKRHNDDSPTPFMVVATHADMASERAVSPEEGQLFAKDCGQYSGYIEVSNKDRTNVDETFSELVRLVRKLHQPLEGRDSQKKAKKQLHAKCSIL